MTQRFLILTLFFLPIFLFGQAAAEYTTVKTKSGNLKIPGKWVELNTTQDSGQTYLTKDDVIIAVAQNPKSMYSFYKSNASDFENVKLFYAWDSDFYNENNFKTDKLKEDAKLEYVIWKYNDGKTDNVYLFGSAAKNFLNLLVYTNSWNEGEKIRFLENLYNLNK